MASGFPGSIDSFTNPLSNSALNSPSHAGQHQDLNDAANKIETYMGLVKVIPTSVSSVGGTSATLAANGTITVGTGNTSITVNGAFSSLYDNYRVIMSGGTGSAAVADLTFQLSGITTGYYGGAFGVQWTTGNAVGRGLGNTANFTYAGSSDTGAALMSLDVFNPFKTMRKHFRSDNYYSNTNEIFGIGQATNGSTASATGFVIGVSTGSVSGGTIRVYGYRN